MNLTAICAAVAFAVGASTAWKLTADHYDAAAARAQKSSVKTVNASSSKLEGKKNESRIVYRTVTRNVQTTVDRPIYRADCLDDGGLRDADAALARGVYTRKPDAAMPGPDADGGQDRGGRAAEDR